MRKVTTRPPSFPNVAFDEPIPSRDREEWQVLCGDTHHWRAGLYTPGNARQSDVTELEKHDCPELFLLLSGRVVLVIRKNGETREVELKAGKPVLVDAPHSGYCPDGPMTGVAFVVERDSFDTEYRAIEEW